MKCISVLLLVFLLAISTFSMLSISAKSAYVHQSWAVIICGDTNEFGGEAMHIYNVLNDHYEFDEIAYRTKLMEKTALDRH